MTKKRSHNRQNFFLDMVENYVGENRENNGYRHFYDTIPTFNTIGKKFYENSMGKENAGRPAFSPFLTMFSTLSKKNFTLLASFSLSSANALKFDHSKILRLIKS